MSHDEMRTRLAEVRDELEDMLVEDALTEEQEARFSELEAEARTITTTMDGIEERHRLVEFVRSAADRGALRPADRQPLDSDPLGDERSLNRTSTLDNPWDLDAVRTATPTDLRARALSAAERMQGSRPADREALTRMIETMSEDSPAESRTLRHIITTSSPDYMRQWGRAFRASLRGASDGEAVTFLSRAMSLTDSAGGFSIPQQLDPTLILTSDGSTNPIRQIARKVMATGDTWTGLSTTHASWSWDAEASEVSDDATTFAQPSIPVYTARGFIPFSIEIGMDYPNFTEDVRTILARGRDDLEATAFATGTGSAQPTGIVTALAGGASEVASATTDVFAVADLYAVEEGLPAKYRGRAQWAANKAIYNDVRQFGTADSHALWERLGAGQPNELLGYPSHEASAMDGAINASADNYVLVLGDWSNFVIADRIGMSIELVPHLLHTSNNRPSGQRGFLAYYRVGSDSVNDGGFSMLNVT